MTIAGSLETNFVVGPLSSIFDNERLKSTIHTSELISMLKGTVITLSLMTTLVFVAEWQI